MVFKKIKKIKPFKQQYHVTGEIYFQGVKHRGSERKDHSWSLKPMKRAKKLKVMKLTETY